LIRSYEIAAEKATRCLEWFFRDFNIPVFSAYSVSLDNITKRSESDLTPIYKVQMKCYSNWLKSGLLKEEKIRVKFVGETHLLPHYYRVAIKRLEDATKKYKDHKLFLLCAYSGQLEIVRAVKRLVNEKAKIFNSLLELVYDFHSYLDINIPLDLIIRTAGEMRVSNSMLYQSAYAEYYLINKYFPAITKGDIRKALEDYRRRRRKIGK
jgi:tritrans,polycis-undecaprenyl-diphosphate synthase [geranylgeranyl-diphosphate specific]